MATLHEIWQVLVGNAVFFLSCSHCGVATAPARLCVHGMIGPHDIGLIRIIYNVSMYSMISTNCARFMCACL